MRLGAKPLIIILCVVFALPPLLSWYLFNYTDLGQNASGGSQHGVLIVPPRPLPDWPLIDPAGDSAGDPVGDPASDPGGIGLHGKWTLLSLLHGNCAHSCARNLYKMRQLRLATGKHARRVQRALLVANGNPDALSPAQLQEYPGQLLLFPAAADITTWFALSDADNPFTPGRLYLVDPQGNLMMSYADTTEPKGIIKDLTRLLKYSRGG